jgi:CheY-like chemotaxis protein
MQEPSTSHFPVDAIGSAATAEKRPARLLLMDDEGPILELMDRLLTNRGYTVATALDGGIAVTQFRSAAAEGAPFDLVVLDLTVPNKMGGFEAYQAMRMIDPNIKAIISSGYSHEPVILNYKDYGIAGIAPKPYRAMELLKAIENVLAA